MNRDQIEMRTECLNFSQIYPSVYLQLFSKNPNTGFSNKEDYKNHQPNFIIRHLDKHLTKANLKSYEEIFTLS